MHACKLALVFVALAACGVQERSSSDGGTSGDDDSGGGGGGSGVDPLDIAKSGTRIKMKVASAGDGAKTLLGMYDSMRNEDCSFQMASDGMLRCLPTQMAFGGDTYFANSTCTQPAGYYYVGCTAPAYIAVTATAGCPIGAGPTIYSRGAAISTVYVKSGTTCTATSLGASFATFMVGAPVAPTSFQAATTAIE